MRWQELETWLFTFGTDHPAVPGARVVAALSWGGDGFSQAIPQARKGAWGRSARGAGCRSRVPGVFPGPFFKSKGNPPKLEDRRASLGESRNYGTLGVVEEVWLQVAPPAMKK